MRFRLALLSVAALLLRASPLSASLQLKIVEIFGGTEAAPDAQYVILQMYGSGQNLVSGQSLFVYDATGVAVPGGIFTFPSNVSNGTDQARILIATSAAQNFFNVTPDLLMTPVLFRSGAAVCLDAATGGALIDCVGWGGYVGSFSGPPGVGTPFGAPAGIPTGQALKRRLDICGAATTLDSCDDRDDSSIDFVLGTPAPINNAGTSGSIPPFTCGNGTLEGLEGCDDGNTTSGDGCSSTCRVEAGGFAAQAMAVDPSPTATSNGNGILEPMETAVLLPTWKNMAASARPLLGSASTFIFASISPGDQAVPDGNAQYGVVASNGSSDCSTTGDCYQVYARPVTAGTQIHVDYTFTEILNNGDSKDWKVHVGASFSDVPPSSNLYRFVETILHNQVTGGCQMIPVYLYCPSSTTTRGQMAVFLLVSKEGPGYTPPPCIIPAFSDVPCSNGFAPWVNELAARNVTAGCGGGNYCPGDPVTRAQMAVFLLRTKEGSAYTPPPCTTPIFADVPCSNGFAPWINELANRGITAGCGGGNYCPNSPNTRGQMAVFLTTTFGLILYGP